MEQGRAQLQVMHLAINCMPHPPQLGVNRVGICPCMSVVNIPPPWAVSKLPPWTLGDLIKIELVQVLHSVCFRGNSMGYHGNSKILLPWGVPIHHVFYSVYTGTVCGHVDPQIIIMVDSSSFIQRLVATL